MIFSTVLFTIKSIKDAQQKGLNSVKYEIQLSDILSDYTAMQNFYQNALPSVDIETIRKFAVEVNEFYSIVDRIYGSNNSLTNNENAKLAKVYKETRKIKETLALKNLKAEEKSN